MSRAFKRESDESGVPETPMVRAQLPPGSRNYITQEGAAHLRHRLNELLQRKQAPTGANEADRAHLDANIRRLQAMLQSVVVAGPPPDPTRIAFGASVAVQRENGEQDVYRIVGVDEADPGMGRISWVSPLAKALLSRKAGDKVELLSPSGVEELIVLKVEYPGPE